MGKRMYDMGGMLYCQSNPAPSKKCESSIFSTNDPWRRTAPTTSIDAISPLLYSSIIILSLLDRYQYLTTNHESGSTHCLSPPCFICFAAELSTKSLHVLCKTLLSTTSVTKTIVVRDLTCLYTVNAGRRLSRSTFSTL